MDGCDIVMIMVCVYLVATLRVTVTMAISNHGVFVAMMTIVNMQVALMIAMQVAMHVGMVTLLH